MALQSCGRVGQGAENMQQLKKKAQERKHGKPQSSQGWTAKQHLPGAAEILNIMFWPTKKDLKTALEVFALFQWALSALVLGESLSYSGASNHMSLPGIEGSMMVGWSMFKIYVVQGKLKQSFTLACGLTHLGWNLWDLFMAAWAWTCMCLCRALSLFVWVCGCVHVCGCV